MTERNGRLTVGFLGPLVVSVGGRPIELGQRRLRALVVMLALSAGRAVSVDRLAVAVWGDDLPVDVRGSVQTYVWRLRSRLGADSIGTVGDGYVLHAAPDDVDGLRLVRLLDAQAQQSDTGGLRARLDEALVLWRGVPFEGVRSAWLAESEAPRLVERYLAAVEQRVDLAVAEGRYVDLVPKLSDLTSQHPLRESLWARLLVVLDRCGRSAEALDRFETIRSRIADELGVDPGPELQGIHSDLLVHTRSEPVGGAASAGTWRPIPRQLPADIDAFAGRDTALNGLDRVLGGASDVARRPMVIIAITGTAGVGKTSLAVHWAHRVADRFPDGQFYVNLRGFDGSRQATTTANAVRGFLDALQVPAEQIPAPFEAQVGLYRSRVAGKRMLVMLDNARDADQVRPLLPGASGCLVVITSRDRLFSLLDAEVAHLLTLDLLTTAEARQLLTRRLGPDRIAADPQAVDDIITQCARLPIALAIVAARAAAHPQFPLATLAGELRDVHSSLDALSGDDPSTDVRAVFSWSYRSLRSPAARLFRLLGVHPGPDFATAAAASLAGVPVREVSVLLTELARAHLITEHVPGRYTFHDLLRTYAAELAHSDEPDTEQHAAIHRALDHYLHTANTADVLLRPFLRTRVVPAPPWPGVVPQEFVDAGQATDWFATEHRVLLATINQAAATGFDTHTWQLVRIVAGFLDGQGRWADLITIEHAALDAAQRLADQAGQARSHRWLGIAYARTGGIDDAHSHLGQALDMYTALGDPVGQANTHQGMAWVDEQLGRLRDALGHAHQAHDLFHAAGLRAGQGDALNNIGWYLTLLGDHEQARATCHRALLLHRDTGDRHGEATTWDSLGYTHHCIGQYSQATTSYQHAIDLFRNEGDLYYEADTLTKLGDNHHAAKDTRAARIAWQHALEILTELGHIDASHVRAKLHETRDRS